MKENNLAQREQILNEKLVRLEYDEKRVKEKKYQLKEAQLKYKKEEDEYQIQS
jgi:hypothetical protein